MVEQGHTFWIEAERFHSVTLGVLDQTTGKFFTRSRLRSVENSYVTSLEDKGIMEKAQTQKNCVVIEYLSN